MKSREICLALAGLAIAGLCGTVSATPGNLADAAWNRIFQPIDGLTFETMEKSLEFRSPRWWDWSNRWREQLTIRGMAFWDAYPQDERRWEWLNVASSQFLLYQSSPPREHASAASHAADEAWSKRRMEFRAAAMARAMTHPQESGWQEARWRRLYKELEARIDEAHRMKLDGRAVDTSGLLDALVDYCMETYLSDGERSFSLGDIVRRAIDLVLYDDLDMQARLVDALTVVVQELPARESISLRIRLKDYISATLRPLHDIRLRPFELRMTSMDGTVIDLRQLRGKVVLIDFWNTGCSSCVKAMPHIQAVYDRYRDQGFEVVGVVFNTETERERVEELFARTGAKWPQSLQGKLLGEDRSALAQRFNFTGLPWTFLLGRDGRLVSTNTREELLEPQVRRLVELGRDTIEARRE